MHGGASADVVDIICRMRYMGDIRSEFAAEGIHVELQSHSPVSQTRKIDRRGLQIEAVCQSESGECQAIAFPVSSAAQLRTSLPTRGGGTHKLGSGEPAGFRVA